LHSDKGLVLFLRSWYLPRLGRVNQGKGACRQEFDPQFAVSTHNKLPTPQSIALKPCRRPQITARGSLGWQDRLMVQNAAMKCSADSKSAILFPKRQ